MRKSASVAAAALFVGGLVLSGATPSAAITSPVDITVDLSLGGVARSFAVSDVVPGPGSELTEADETANPSGFCGALEVDIDPDADTISLLAADDECFFDLGVVTITSSELTSVELVSDTAMVGANPVDVDLTAGVLTLTFTPVESSFDIGFPGGATVLSYAAAPPAPVASLSPAEVEAGDPVTVTGDRCGSGPIMATITAEGGTTVVDDEEQTVADGAGDWTFEIDTTGYAPGTYSVATRCVQADLAGFDYDVLTFTVTAPTPPPAGGPQPVVVAPRYTG